MKFRLISYLIMMLLSFTASAIASLNFSHLSVKEGLPSVCIRSIAQDSVGFMWFATDGGVVRYDGKGLNIYHLHCDANSINYDFPMSIHCRNGEVWIGADYRLYRYNPAIDDFTPFCDSARGNKPINAPIHSVTSGKDGSLWFAINGEGVGRIRPGHSASEVYSISEFSNWIGQVYVDSRDDVWVVSTQGQGNIYKYNKDTNRFERFSLSGLSQNIGISALTIFEDSHQNMWLGTWTDGLVVFDPETGKVLHDRIGDDMIHIHSIVQYSPESLLIGSDSGLALLNLSTLDYSLNIADELNPRSLSDQFVYPIFIDTEGGTWVGTFYGGVNYLPPSLKNFEFWQHSLYRNSVGGNIISKFCEDTDGNIWIASDDGGLNRFDPKTGKFEQIKLQSNDNLNIHALCLDYDNLWIGTYANGVLIYNIKTGKVTHHFNSTPSDESTIDNNSSYAIYRDSSGDIWVATMEGINLYDRKTNTFSRIKQVGAMTIDIDEDEKGRLWFATQGRGLLVYNPKTRVWKNYRASNEPGSLTHNHINALLIDSKGTIWVANSRGLCHYDNSTDSFIKDRLDIPSKEIFSITENNSQLWLTTVNCLVRYEPNGESVIFTPDDGLVEGQFIANSAFRASNGKIYVGTNMGFNSFFPSQIKQNTISPRVVFTGLDIANEKILPGDKRMPRMLNDLDEIVLSHEDYAVTIHFASLSYCNPDKNQYAFIMEGFDKNWTYSGNNGTATYTNLPAGKYRFLVRATNNDGKWCDNPIVLTIKVTPPWWLSLPMKILYMIQVLIFLAIIIRLFLKRSEKKHQVEIKSMEDRKEKEVYQAKLDFFTMIAHEIRTPVSLIMGPLEKIMHSSYKFTPEVKDDLEIINRNNDRLLFLVNQLLDFEKVEQNALSVYFKPQHMAQLINAVVERFKPSVEHMGGHLTINNFNDSFIADVDAEAFTKLISNLLNNARKFMKDTIHVECKVHPEAGTFSVAVSDNGIGVSKESQEKIFKPFFQVQNDSQVSRGGTGIGLSIVRNVVEGHGGTIDVDSEEGKGATFTVTIPIHNARAEESFNDEDMPEGIEDEAIEDTIECSDRQLILVVEDNPEMQSFIAGIFRSEFEVITASDGVEALELLHKNTVTLIISDWMMPRMDGVQLCKAVRGDVNYSHIPFILLTAKTDNHSKIEGVNCGADVYIEKPFSVQYLSACVHNIIDMRDLLRKKFSSTPLVPISAIATNQTENDFLVRLNEVIEENFSNPDLSVDFLAEQMNISRSGLYAKIKTLASISPNELILIARLKKAAVLLKDGNYRIKEICAMVGFNSPSYFTKCFYRQFGVRPTDFTGEQPQ